MIRVTIDRPILNRPTPEENLALVDTWIADTADKLNYMIDLINKERTQDDGK